MPPADGARDRRRSDGRRVCRRRRGRNSPPARRAELVRDPATRELRPIAPRDIGILFRTKDSHQDFEKALERRQIPSYVYKGLGFFEADEIKDVLALLRYLASPESNLRAAAFLRSRFVRLSDPALQALAPDLAAALSGRALPDARRRSDSEDRLVLERARAERGALAGPRRSAAAGGDARDGARRDGVSSSRRAGRASGRRART